MQTGRPIREQEGGHGHRTHAHPSRVAFVRGMLQRRSAHLPTNTRDKIKALPELRSVIVGV